MNAGTGRATYAQRVGLSLLVAASFNVGAREPSSFQKYAAAEAASHVGETATVCGRVASATYAARSRGKPTFINLDEPYPRHVFTGVIWIEDRAKFGQPETTLMGKSVCMSGKIGQFRGKPEIVLRSTEQLTPMH